MRLFTSGLDGPGERPGIEEADPMKARFGLILPSRSLSFLLLALLTSASILLVPREVRAQSAANTGQIVGLVVDPTLASVAGAEVAVRNTNTNFSRTTVADAGGRFTLPLLPLGPYEITAKAAGFEATTQEAVVMLGSTVTANFTLSVGMNREAIDVSGAILPLPLPERCSPICSCAIFLSMAGGYRTSFGISPRARLSRSDGGSPFLV